MLPSSICSFVQPPEWLFWDRNLVIHSPTCRTKSRHLSIAYKSLSDLSPAHLSSPTSRQWHPHALCSSHGRPIPTPATLCTHALPSTSTDFRSLLRCFSFGNSFWILLRRVRCRSYSSHTASCSVIHFGHFLCNASRTFLSSPTRMKHVQFSIRNCFVQKCGEVCGTGV